MDELLGFFVGYIVVTIILACVFGAITKSINEGKGYDGGFAWGFWLGWIGIIVVACRRPNPYYFTPTESIIVKETPPPGGWKCTCGRTHASYVSSCSCGKNKHELQKGIPAKSAAPAAKSGEKESIALLKEYKDLLDQGIITQEEFEQKKKTLLSAFLSK